MFFEDPSMVEKAAMSLEGGSMLKLRGTTKALQHDKPMMIDDRDSDINLI